MIQLQVNPRLLLKCLNRGQLATALFWKATDFGSKVTLIKSPLLFRLGSLMASCVHFINKICQGKRKKQCFPLPSQVEQSFGCSPTNMFIEMRPKNV